MQLYGHGTGKCLFFSPHNLIISAGGNSTMMALIEQHRTNRNSGASNNNNNPGLSLYGTSKVQIVAFWHFSAIYISKFDFCFAFSIVCLQTGRLSPNSFSVHGAGELKLNIAPLPSSPFVHLSRGSFSEGYCGLLLYGVYCGHFVMFSAR